MIRYRRAMFAAWMISPEYGRLRSLIAAIFCATLCGCGFTLLMPVMALNLEAMTGSGVVVGLNGAVTALSTIVATPFVPRLMQRWRGRPLIVTSLAVTALTIPFFPLFPEVWLWFALRFAMGLAITVVFVASETWINQISPPEKRATVLGLYATALASGFGAGGLLLAALGSSGWAPWLAAFLLFSGGSLPILFLRGPGIEQPDADSASISAMIRAAGIAPAAIGAGLLFGATETMFFALFPVYGERIGLIDTAIGFMMAAGALGGIILQAPLGRLADSVGRLRVAIMAAIVCVIGPGLVYLSGAAPLALYAVMFGYVGIATGLYTLGLALIGERFDGGSLVGANAAFVMAYGVGSLFGPAIGGGAMDAIDPQGVLIVSSALALTYLIFLLVRHFTRKQQLTGGKP
ncbi:MFS transporter [Hyphobacterium sp. HN65]|uniref:MFS transporter n=1 Tax=Hyphobacterium lacteum TaxID=3116575 RepID=A0ABU7LMI0_9PROT|nr:MFS transporter [Hyphobacterium sp. HN65]MEE2525130.1 MFS transporter [Hyphobacterium sp. HN65]